MATHREVMRQVRAFLDGSTGEQRAELLEDVTRALYDHVKFDRGGGPDYQLETLTNRVINYHDEVRAEAMEAREAPVSSLTTLLDALLALAAHDHPAVEYAIWASSDVADQIPRHAEHLWRPGPQGEHGYYRGHVYRDTLVERMEPSATEVRLVPLQDGTDPASAATTYVGHTQTGEITKEDP